LKQPFYLLPLAWAFFGFVMRFDGLPQTVAAILGALLLAYFILQVVAFYRQQKPVPVRSL
jgi:hypothetical protein